MEDQIKKELEIIKSNPYKRLLNPSPKFFINIQKWCLYLAFASGAISSYLLSINTESKLGIALASFAGFLGVFGTILAKLPIDEEKIKENIINQNENK